MADIAITIFLIRTIFSSLPDCPLPPYLKKKIEVVIHPSYRVKFAVCQFVEN